MVIFFFFCSFFFLPLGLGATRGSVIGPVRNEPRQTQHWTVVTPPPPATTTSTNNQHQNCCCYHNNSKAKKSEGAAPSGLRWLIIWRMIHIFTFHHYFFWLARKKRKEKKQAVQVTVATVQLCFPKCTYQTSIKDRDMAKIHWTTGSEVVSSLTTFMLRVSSCAMCQCIPGKVQTHQKWWRTNFGMNDEDILFITK